jgi:hypothetical protein
MHARLNAGGGGGRFRLVAIGFDGDRLIIRLWHGIDMPCPRQEHNHK